MNIKQLRKETGLTLQEIADTLNVSKQIVSAWENNIKPIPQERQKDLESLFYFPECAKKYTVTLSYEEYMKVLRILPNISLKVK